MYSFHVHIFYNTRAVKTYNLRTYILIYTERINKRDKLDARYANRVRDPNLGPGLAKLTEWKKKKSIYDFF